MQVARAAGAALHPAGHDWARLAAGADRTAQAGFLIGRQDQQ